VNAASLWQRLVEQGALSRIFRFGLVSGVGLTLDVCLFAVLVRTGMRPGWANLISAGAAVTFVYFASTRRVFAYEGRFLYELFLVYVAYQLLAVAAASWAVDALVRFGMFPVVAKLAILPVTFSANYLFMRFLTKPR
jgi:putative flippase GtrA